MKQIPPDVEDQLLLAMDDYKLIAEQLMHKLVSESSQPKRDLVESGEYIEIQNATGSEYLSNNWYYFVHGDHCMFKNQITGQTLEIRLLDKASIGNIDPTFFWQFLETTERLKHLTTYFDSRFQDTLTFFERMVQEGKMTLAQGVEFRKVAAI